MRYIKGFSLVELMVAVALAMGISLASMTLFLNESKMMFQGARKDHAAQEGMAAFDAIADIIAQSQLCLFSCGTPITIDIAYPLGISNPNSATTLALANDSVQIDMLVPSGFAIWPNITAPYTNNAIRMNWDSATGLVTVSAGASKTDAASLRTPITVAGSSNNLGYKVINFDLWPMTTTAGVIAPASLSTAKPTGGYLLSMTIRSGISDQQYTNTLDPTGPMQHYRTSTFTRVIVPRNW